MIKQGANDQTEKQADGTTKSFIVCDAKTVTKDDGTTVNVPKNKIYTNINDALMNLFIMHVSSATLFLVSYAVRTGGPRNYIHNIFQVASVPYYHISILLAYFELMHLIAGMRQEHMNYCHDAMMEVSLRQAWIEFELAAFYANIAVLIMFLMSQQRWAGGGKILCCRSCYH